MGEKDYETLSEELLAENDQLLGILIVDNDGNMIHLVNTDFSNIDFHTNDACFSSALMIFGLDEFVKYFGSSITNDIIINSDLKSIYISKIDENRILVLFAQRYSSHGVNLMLIESYTKKFSKIPYEIPEPRRNIITHLNDMKARFDGKYRIFISYAQKDTSYFQIKDIATSLEQSETLSCRYYERDIRAGMELSKYMEEGVKWADIFLLFHSKNVVESEAVQNECKLAEKYGKKILIIIDDFQVLPERYKNRWGLYYKNFKFNELIQEIKVGIGNLFK